MTEFEPFGGVALGAGVEFIEDLVHQFVAKIQSAVAELDGGDFDREGSGGFVANGVAGEEEGDGIVIDFRGNGEEGQAAFGLGFRGPTGEGESADADARVAPAAANGELYEAGATAA
jgi:hypothetical protein